MGPRLTAGEVRVADLPGSVCIGEGDDVRTTFSSEVSPAESSLNLELLGMWWIKKCHQLDDLVSAFLLLETRQ